jgi:iduronate 2-sulfatase
MGYTMRTDRYRLVLWLDDRDQAAEPLAVELYDYQSDSKADVNLAARPEYRKSVDQLISQRKSGWRAALPSRGGSGR